MIHSPLNQFQDKGFEKLGNMANVGDGLIDGDIRLVPRFEDRCD